MRNGVKSRSAGKRAKFFGVTFFLVPFSFFIFNFALAKEIPLPEEAYRGIEVGPRALGMGGAFVGLANDPLAPYWNPAGLTQMSYPVGMIVSANLKSKIDRAQDLFNPYTLFDDAQFNFISFVSRRSGLGWRQVNKINKHTYDVGSSTDCWSNLHEIFLTAARGQGQTALGVNFKYLFGNFLQWEKSKDGNGWREPILDRSNGQGFGLDLGLIYIVSEYLNIGVVGENVFTRVWWKGYETVRVSPKLRVGANLEWPGYMNFTFDLEKISGKKNKPIYHLGVEGGVYGISLRTGIFGEDITETKSNESTITVGIGYKYKKFQIDIAGQARQWGKSAKWWERMTYIGSFSLGY